LLELLKTGTAAGVQHDDLTIEYGCGCGDRLDGSRNARELRGPIYAVATPEPDLTVIDAAKHAVAIKLQLMQPLVSCWRFFDERRKLRRDEIRQCVPASAFELYEVGSIDHTEEL